jgi:hypothetical protein
LKKEQGETVSILSHQMGEKIKDLIHEPPSPILVEGLEEV